MGPRAWIVSVVVIVLAGHAYGQPSQADATGDATTAAGTAGSAAPVQGNPNPPPPPDPSSPTPDPSNPPNPSSPPPYPPSPSYVQPQPHPVPPPDAVALQRPREKKPRHTLCFAGRPFDCASVLLFELGARGDRYRSVATADVGLLIHNGLDAYGATIGVLGISDAKAGASVWFAGRYRRYIGRWGLAGDVSVGYAGGPAIDVAIGWADVVALTAGINRYELEDGGHDIVASAGIRVGSVTIGGLFYLTALVFAGAR